MRRRKRRLRGRELKKHRKFLIIGIISLICIFSVGYAAFSTNISVNVKGNTKIMYASDTMKKLLRNNSLTMFTDPFGNIRYTGPNDDVHNYVCLVDENPCQDKHLFRIIGSFLNIDDGTGKLETRVKVIKATPYSEDSWDASGSNNWARPATLNTTLNTTYYASLDSEVQNLIGNSVWNLGASDVYTKLNTIESYNYERGNTKYCDDINDSSTCNSTAWNGKIALIYPSDYGFSSSTCKDNTILNAYGDEICKNNSWIFSDSTSNMWFLTALSIKNTLVNFMPITGRADNNYAYSKRRILPSFFLKSNTLLITKNHDGNFNNPYIVMLDEN